MISSVSMMGYTIAALLSIGCGIFPILLLWKRSSRIETGMLGSVCYGGLGYIWAQLMIGSFIMVMINQVGFFVTMKKEFYFGYLCVRAIVTAFMATLAFVWGIFLANQKQKSLYRSTVVGISYGLVVSVIYTMMPLYEAVQVNAGKIAATDPLAQSIMSTSVVDVILGGFKYGALSLFYGAVALVMSKLWNEGLIQKPSYIGFGAFLVVGLIRSLIGLLPVMIGSRIVDTVFLAVLAYFSVRLMKNWKNWEPYDPLRTGIDIEK